MANNLWFGYENGGTKWFRVPDDYEIKTESRKKVVDGVKYFSMGRVYWYTNLDTTKRHEPITLYKRYTPEEYPTYTNYPAIEVSKVSDIPMDYDGEMGVPITFLDRYNPDQFEIIGQQQLARPSRCPTFAAKEDLRGRQGRGGRQFYVPQRRRDAHGACTSASSSGGLEPHREDRAQGDHGPRGRRGLSPTAPRRASSATAGSSTSGPSTSASSSTTTRSGTPSSTPSATASR